MTEIEIEQAIADTEIAANQGDRWTFMAVLPESSFIHTVHSGERTLEQAQLFLAQIKNKSDGQAPFFHSDGWFYTQALTDTYCTYQTVPYSGRGRPCNPIQIVDNQLLYGQVIKERNSKGKIEKVSTRILLGDESKILEILNDSSRSKTINTDFVESRNGKFRKDDARLIRKTLCFSKKACFHDAHIRFLAQVVNYTRTVDALKITINPDAKRFQQKFKHQTPAMAQKIIDKILSLKELLFIRPQVVKIAIT